MWPFLTMNLQHMLGAGLSVQVIDALRDHDHGAALLLQPGLTFCYGHVDGTGLFVQHQLPSVMIKLPDSRGVARKGLGSCKILKDATTCTKR